MTFRRIAIAVAALVVLGGVTLFILDRTIFAPAAVSTGTPVAPTLVAPTQLPAAPGEPTVAAPSGPAATEAAPPASGASDAGAVLYRIDASQSEVRYEVDETFFQGNRLNTAIGRTRGIAGDVLVDFAQPSSSQIGEIVIDVSQFTSDESRRDNFIRRDGLQSSTYPTARFLPTSIEDLPEQVAIGDRVSFRVNGDLTVKETTRPVTWDMTLTVEDGRLVGSASTQILMSDFGVGPIQLAILVTEDQVNLFFDFVAVPVEG
jgi:polyisoprenoid-binding protein YceI